MMAKNEATYQTTAILANGVELGCKVIRKIAGNDVSDSVGGEVVSSDELRRTFTAKLNSYINAKEGGVK